MWEFDFCLGPILFGFCDKSDQKQLGEDGAFVSHKVRAGMEAGTWKETLKDRPWGVLLTGLLSSACFLTGLQTTWPVGGPTHSELDPPT